MYKFILVGPNRGKSGVWGGFRFVDGVCTLKTDHDAECAAKILPNFYSAWPEDIAKYKQIEYENVQVGLGASVEEGEDELNRPEEVEPVASKGRSRKKKD
jgi:hypothetical protein